MDFILWASPTQPRGQPTREPHHLQEMVDILQRTILERQKACFSCCPQSGKSELLLHTLAWFAWNKPGTASAYITYGDDLAHLQSRRCWAICERAGLNPTGSEKHIRLSNGSIIHFASFGGPIEGFPVDGILLVDDAYKDRESAWSEAERTNVNEKFYGTLIGRIHEDTSLIVCGHRWSPFDLIQDLSDSGWFYKNYPALRDVNGLPDLNGESFAPWLKSRDLILDQKKIIDVDDIFAFESEYQGNPRPRQGTLFDTSEAVWRAHEYDVLPKSLTNYIGLDLAYTESTAADYTVAAVVGHLQGTYYLREIIRGKWSDPKLFLAPLDGLRTRYHSPVPPRWDTSAQETATARLIDVNPVKIPAGFKIYQRSMTLVSLWQTGLFKVPRSAPWLPAFKAEMRLFTGQDDKHDDQIAAVASALEASRHNPGSPQVLARPKALSDWTL